MTSPLMTGASGRFGAPGSQALDLNNRNFPFTPETVPVWLH